MNQVQNWVINAYIIKGDDEPIVEVEGEPIPEEKEDSPGIPSSGTETLSNVNKKEGNAV